MTNFIRWNSLFRIYPGLDDTEANPLFTGIPIGKSGRNPIKFKFTDYLGYFNRIKDIKIDDYNNFDGMEAGQSIIEVADGGDFSMFSTALSTAGVQGTYPPVYLDDTLRFKNYTSRLNVITAMNERCWDISGYPSIPEPYIFWVDDTTLYHQKQTRLADATPIATVATADNLITSEPRWDLMKVINKQTVVGASYVDGYDRKRNYEGTHSDASSIEALGIVSGAPVKDESLTTVGDCEAKAQRIVEAYKEVPMFSSISVVENWAYNIIPGRDCITVTDSDYGIEGTHRISEVRHDFGGGKTVSTIVLDTTMPLLTDYI